jgi:hypothetical protein
MSHRQKHYPAQLSGGQQQRVAVARAVVGDPAILLADEPTGNLDSANGESVMELLQELHRGGATVCMVTHDPRYAQHAERTIHLFDGRVVEETTTPDLDRPTMLPTVRQALRALGRSPGFTLAALATFAIGIGANATVFGVVNAVLLRSYPFAEPDRWSRSTRRQRGGTTAPSRSRRPTSATGRRRRAASRRWRPWGADYTLRGDGEPERLSGAASRGRCRACSA